MFFLFIFCFDEAVSAAPVEEAIVAETGNITGDRGNPSYIKQLNQLNENTQNQGNPRKHKFQSLNSFFYMEVFKTRTCNLN